MKFNLFSLVNDKRQKKKGPNRVLSDLDYALFLSAFSAIFGILHYRMWHETLKVSVGGLVMTLLFCAFWIGMAFSGGLLDHGARHLGRCAALLRRQPEAVFFFAGAFRHRRRDAGRVHGDHLPDVRHGDGCAADAGAGDGRHLCADGNAAGLALRRIHGGHRRILRAGRAVSKTETGGCRRRPRRNPAQTVTGYGEGAYAVSD